jgi:hypothetical protein
MRASYFRLDSVLRQKCRHAFLLLRPEPRTKLYRLERLRQVSFASRILRYSISPERLDGGAVFLGAQALGIVQTTIPGVARPPGRERV